MTDWVFKSGRDPPLPGGGSLKRSPDWIRCAWLNTRWEVRHAADALGRRKEDYTSAKGRELATAMRQMKGWYKGTLKRTKLYGAQVVYIRKGSDESKKLLSL